MCISIEQAPLLREDEIAARQNTLLTCQQARTIASWWQSSNLVGSAMAELASTGTVDSADLLSDILSSLGDVDSPFGDRTDLCDLYAWTVYQVNRKV